MQRKITGFHLDEEGHWVAELECGHNQHVRHDPPYVERPWVITEHGRRSRLGQELNCVRCDEDRCATTGRGPADRRGRCADAHHGGAGGGLNRVRTSVCDGLELWSARPSWTVLRSPRRWFSDGRCEAVAERVDVGIGRQTVIGRGGTLALVVAIAGRLARGSGRTVWKRRGRCSKRRSYRSSRCRDRLRGRRPDGRDDGEQTLHGLSRHGVQTIRRGWWPDGLDSGGWLVRHDD